VCSGCIIGYVFILPNLLDFMVFASLPVLFYLALRVFLKIIWSFYYESTLDEGG